MALTGFQQKLSKELISQAQQGDMQACKVIYTTYADASFSLAFRISGNHSTAQDIVQEAFIKVISKIKNYKNEGVFAGWLRRIVLNESINRIKSENRIHLVDLEETKELPTNDLFDQNWLSACRDLDVLLINLSATARAVLLLHEVEGYNHKEIAAMYGRSESFSKVTLSRAYASLKEQIRKEELQNASN